LVASVVFAQGLHIASMQIPFMQSLLRVKPVSLREWLIVAALSLLLLLIMEIYKAANRKFKFSA
ncbi:MAG TPA: cation transporting ATPase C-terminal domain-containing protein, partial [Candidatus Goldiibacteriota bacterium]|nr:cation transporting ATPase C-terminal domain-containing protein [Candidatus Goldiibacteriota bacterium]